jgi:hypothetical protein
LALEAFSEKLSTEEKQKAEKRFVRPNPIKSFSATAGKTSPFAIRFSPPVFSPNPPICRFHDLPIFPALAHLDIQARQGYPFIRNEKRTVTAPSSSLV